MTRKGEHPTTLEQRRKVARLLHIHLLTHPERIARRFGLTSEWARQQWRNSFSPADMASMREVVEELEALAGSAKDHAK